MFLQYKINSASEYVDIFDLYRLGNSSQSVQYHTKNQFEQIEF